MPLNTRGANQVVNQKPNIQHIHHRADLLRKLRGFFDERGFHEVQPPCLMRQCIADTHIEPITIAGQAVTGRTAKASAEDTFFLQTSPELAMKRMLAAGAGSIYAIVPVFRRGEIGDQHNVEFTMLEWYEVGADANAAIRLLGELAKQIFAVDRCDVQSYRDLFAQQLSIDPIDAPLEDLVQLVGMIDQSLARSLAPDRDGMLDVLMSQKLQPNMGQEAPLIIHDYPITQAALAKASQDDPQCALRFELFYRGVELANGYDELRDADVLWERSDAIQSQRAALGRPSLPMPTDLIEAMRQGLPQCAGVAMGVDRLLMIRSDEMQSISQTMPMTVGQV
ncbi:Elongation factor P--(R)-beta-lysine ligase [Rubripirellula obstinata]|uniref:Elongation factor P--(R)-beta-lysine ligase n=1 Tax=Rubripirellula obstinata TaxID=406547 RepID=A0A5B1CLT8_9BACT|nr:EF-P lysine aminoacylase EpmA [Rubripirellula obstinata]KAA1261496.1 Elongation factor P--(R)-beta-lysine ligase [Rubripirellula obstinata]